MYNIFIEKWFLSSTNTRRCKEGCKERLEEVDGSKDWERKSFEAVREAFTTWLKKMEDPEFNARFEAEIAQDTISCKKNLDERRVEAIRSFNAKIYTG